VIEAEQELIVLARKKTAADAVEAKDGASERRGQERASQCVARVEQVQKDVAEEEETIRTLSLKTASLERERHRLQLGHPLSSYISIPSVLKQNRISSGTP
jgi:hypothetical protein